MVLSDDSVWLFVSSRYQRYRKNQELPVGCHINWHPDISADMARISTWLLSSRTILYISLYTIYLIFVRIGFVRAQLGYSLRRFIFKDYLPVVSCCLISVIPAWAITKMMDDGVIRLIVITLTCCVTTSIIVFTIGMSRDEQDSLLRI